MAKLPIYVVDAFTSTQFKGNSAAVVPLEAWISEELMQNIAAENNLSETAFIVRGGSNSYQIRWFSPLTEIAFCGHATLATAFVLFNHLGLSSSVEFTTQTVGSLTVTQLSNGKLEMNFPMQMPEPLSEVPSALLKGLSIEPQEILQNRQAYFAIYDTETDVKQVKYDAQLLKMLAPLDVVVSAPGVDDDFVSRYFWPANGGEEDPVTGSIHTGLAPFWAKKLDKHVLHAFQASARGGHLVCEVDFLAQRVTVIGEAVLYLQGHITV
ncbi:PhzF family phenazine biosynthesis protein [Pseudoalteromonas obscura]|uniref:PhzF family phenazine biosynthesis protein n=1 Tax=Pseudoalteromonas obscura TaxID=3048491 RepID=A0ABT7EPH5_9GAMM|nr:PhzF family phenazine biosynthesis protein [Pseudoalteromonas sp. P94(2023)]MDK2596954.1 PhzF family phenazine biosynthesis protein [Pseudoalteromonas sp. P94(2023)]